MCLPVTKPFAVGLALVVSAWATGAFAANGSGGGVTWTTDLPGIASVTGSSTDSWGTHIVQGHASATNASGYVVTADSPWRGFELDPGSQYFAGVYRPDGTYETTSPYQFSNTTSANGGDLIYTLATPARFFAGLVNVVDVGGTAETVSFYSGSTKLLTIDLVAAGTYLSSHSTYAEYLNVSSKSVSFNKIEFDYGAANGNQVVVADFTKSASSASFALNDTTSVPEPGLAALPIVAGFAAIGMVRGRSRRGSSLAA